MCKKLAVIFILLFLLISPVFAEEQKTELEPALEVLEETNFASSLAEGLYQESSGNSPLKSNLPEINKNTGALNYGYKIDVPQGRNGLQPEIYLSYSSNQANAHGIYGTGWADSIPYIQRLNKIGTDALYSSNYFYSSLDGELTSVGSGSYIARTENSSFNKYIFENNSWRIILKNGAQYKFGFSENSRQSNPQKTGDVYKWMLEEIRDTNNNFISYSYFKDAGQIYPEKINYNIFEVGFEKISNPNSFALYTSGFEVSTNYLISAISTKINGSLAKKYSLAYTQGFNGKKTLLDSITLSGMPPMSFKYRAEAIGKAGAGALWKFPNSFEEFEVTRTSNLYPLFIDLNGDNLPDLITLIAGYVMDNNLGSQSYPYKKSKIFLNTGRGWSAEDNVFKLPDNSSWKLPSYHNYLGLGEAYFPDLNADGLADLIERVGVDAYAPTLDYVYLNTGSGWADAPTLKLPEPPETSYSERCYFYPEMRREDYFQIYFPDLNGDGLSDLVQIAKYFCQSSNYVNTQDFRYINTGQGWVSAGSKWDLKEASSWLKAGHGKGDSRASLNFTDLNADGLSDTVIKRPDEQSSSNFVFEAYLNNGLGWTKNDSWNFPVSSVARYIKTVDAQFEDVNMDGYADLLEIIATGTGDTYAIVSYINNGQGWNLPYYSFENIGNRWLLASPTSVFEDFSVPQFPDLNGDGLPDSVEIIEGPFEFGHFRNKDDEKITSGKKQDFLWKIIYPKGGSTEINYKTAVAENKLPYTAFVVSEIKNSPGGSGNDVILSYNYSGGKYYYNNPIDRKFAGFGKIVQTDSEGNVTKTYFDTENYFKLAKPHKTEQYDNQNNLLKLSQNKWEVYNLSDSAGFVKLTQTTEQVFDKTANHKDKAESYVYDNVTGNQTQKTEWGEVVANNDGSFVDTGNDRRRTDISYAASSGSNVLTNPTEIIVVDENNSKIKQSRYYYDNLEFGKINKGNKTKDENWIKDEIFASSETKYNNFGLPEKIKDPNGNETSYLYDVYSLYPETETNALGQQTKYKFNYLNGKPSEITDANGNIFKTDYDGFGRVLKIEEPDGVKTGYVYNDAPLAVNVEKTDYLDAQNNVKSYSYFDGLGRVIQEKKSAENNNFITKDYIYDSRGNLQKESLPYAIPNSALYTNYIYDALNRKTSIANAVGTTAYDYNGWQTTITDANKNKKDFIYDAYGNLSQVSEYPSAGSGQATIYNYDTAGNLVKITDVLGNIRNFTYDGLGRKTSSDGWSYIYDNAGNLTSSTDPKNQTIIYGYDALNRKDKEDYDGKEGIEIIYIYDTCINGKGRLCKTTSLGGIEEFEYSAAGAVVKDTRKSGTENFITQYNYDRQQNLTFIKNPDSSETKYEYNSAGLVEKIPGIVENFNYNPLGQVAEINFASGVKTENTYDQNQLYRLTRKFSFSGGTVLQDLNYKYDAVGNIKKINDTDYIYDDLYRITSASVPYGQSFSYNALGNILTQTKGNQTQTYNYNEINSNAVSKITITGILPLPVILNFSASEIKVVSGQPAVLSWALAGGDINKLEIDNNIGSVLGTDFKIINPTKTATYTLTAEGDGGTVTKQVSVEVISETASASASASAEKSVAILAGAKKPPVKKPVINYFTADKATIFKGESAVLLWALSGGKPTSLVIDKIGSVLKRTSATVYPYVATTYKLTAKNKYGSSVKFLTITVKEKPPLPPIISSLTASAGVLTWTLSGGSPTELFLDNGVGSVMGKTNVVVNPTITTTYTLTAKNDSGFVIKPVTIKVIQPPPPTTIIQDYDYDANGNMTSDGTNIYVYDYNNRMISAHSAGSGQATTIDYAYDTTGQRIKAGDTIYPTQFYNTDGTNITKHIFANNIMLATITGSGADAKTNIILTDHLSGSNIVLDQNNQVIETTDYYPFGEIFANVHPSTSSGQAPAFSEQRKYIGQEFDPDTGLNYLNARYYNGTIAKFLSPDPVSLHTPEKLLQDPQQLNLYSYARNNPITMSDPSGLLTMIIPGTNYNEKDWSSSGSMSNFISSVGKTFNDSKHTQVINDKSTWSGGDNDRARQSAASSIANMINNYRFEDGEPLNIVGHSHGGNIANLVTGQINHQVDNLVTLGTPVRSDYQPNYSMVNKHTNVYSNDDKVQNNGGGIYTVTGLIGAAFLGEKGGQTGDKIGWGEFGSAGREFVGANNINISNRTSWWRPVSSHGIMLRPSIWSSVMNKLIK